MLKAFIKYIKPLAICLSGALLITSMPISSIAEGKVISESQNNDIANKDSLDVTTPSEITKDSSPRTEEQTAKSSTQGTASAALLSNSNKENAEDGIYAYAVEGGNIYYAYYNGDDLYSAYTIQTDAIKIVGADENLKQVEIPNEINGIKVTGIDGHAFSECSELEKVSIPTNVTKIGYYAFYNCRSLENIKIPDKCLDIGEYAFGYCTALEEISLPRELKTLPGHIFICCSALENIDLPNSLTSIEESAFADCTSLTEVLIPPNIQLIGTSAFQRCVNLQKIEFDRNIEFLIGSGVTGINGFAFANCKSLKNIVLPKGTQVIAWDTFAGCSNLESIEIPDSVTSIVNGSFFNCTSLREIRLPKNVEYIHESVFINCSKLETVYIPLSMKEIGTYNFYNCNALKTIYYGGTEEQWNKLTSNMGYIPDSTTVYFNYDSSTDSEDTLPGFAAYLAYDKDTKQVFLGDSLFAYEFSDSVDPADIEALANRYALVEIDEENSFVINSIKPVDSKIGTVTYISKDFIVIDGVFYKNTLYSDDDLFWDDYADEMFLNKKLLYHLYNGIIVGHELLEEKNGIFQSWNGENGIVLIDGVEYKTNYMSNLSFLANIDQLLGADVVYYSMTHNDNAILFEIAGNFFTGTGLFSHYDLLSNKIYIDNDAYDVDAEKCTPNTSELNGQRVFFLVENDKVVHIDSIDKLLPIVGVSLSTNGAKAVYRNGKFTSSQFKVKVEISNKSSYEFPRGYNTVKIYQDESFKKLNGGVRIEKADWQIGSGLYLMKDIDISNLILQFDESWTGEAIVAIEDGYVPAKVSGRIEGSLTIVPDNGQEVTKNFGINVGNLDLTSKRNVDDTESIYEDEIKKLDEKFDFQVMLPGNLTNYVLDNKEVCKNIQRLLGIWVVSLTKEADTKDLETKIRDKAVEVFEKQWEWTFGGKSMKLIKDAKNLLSNKDTDAKVDAIQSSILVRTKAKNGEIIIIRFTYSGIGAGVKTNSGSWGTIAYQIIDPPSEYKRYADGSDNLGMVTSLNIDQFAKELYEVEKKALKDAFNKVYGNNINTIAQYVFNEATLNLLKNYCNVTPSGKIFDFLTSYGSHVFSCPVDVYVYDTEGNLCGSIVNNQIDATSDAVFMDVDGDDKTVWIDDEDFTISLLGTDHGTMQYTIRKYIDDEMVREIVYKDIPLEDGITYSGSLPSAIFLSQENYNLIKEDGTQISPDTDSYVAPNIKDSGDSSNSPSVESVTAIRENGAVIVKANVSDPNNNVLSVQLNYSLDGELYSEGMVDGDTWNQSLNLDSGIENIIAFLIVMDADGNQSVSDWMLIPIQTVTPKPTETPTGTPTPTATPIPTATPTPAANYSASTRSRSRGGSGGGSGSSGSGGSIASGASSMTGTAGSTVHVADATSAPDTPGTWFQNADGSWSYRDASGKNWTGWIVYGHQWYYLGADGKMVVNWQIINGKWYYFHTSSDGMKGRMWLNAKTPDGYTVGADGSWQQ